MHAYFNEAYSVVAIHVEKDLGSKIPLNGGEVLLSCHLHIMVNVRAWHCQIEIFSVTTARIVFQTLGYLPELIFSY